MKKSPVSTPLAIAGVAVGAVSVLAGVAAVAYRRYRASQDDRVSPKTLFPLTEKLVPADGASFVTCWSPKGGIGKTSIALGLGSQLAWGLAGGEPRLHEEMRLPRVLVVDLDEFGDVAMQSEDLRDKCSVEGIGTLPTAQTLFDHRGSVTSWETLLPYLVLDRQSGLYLLMAPQRCTCCNRTMDATDYDRVIKVLAPYFDIVIFDCGPGTVEDNGARVPFALGRADLNVVVGDQTFPVVIHAVKFFVNAVKKMPDLFKGSKDSFLYVVNRYVEGSPSSLKEIKAVMEKFVSEVIAIPAASPAAGLQGSYDGQTPIFFGDRGIKVAYRDLTDSVLRRLNSLRAAPSGD